MGRRASSLRYTAAIAPMIWGTTYIATTEWLPPGRPLFAALARALPTGILLLLWRGTLPRGIWIWRALALGILNIGAFFAFAFVGAYRLPGGVAAVAGSLQPIIVILLVTMVFGSRIRALQLGAAVLGTAGMVMLVAGAATHLDALGVAAALGGAVSMASGTVLTKKWGRPPGVSLRVFSGWQLLAGGLVLLPLTVLVEGLPTHLTPVNVFGYGYLALISSAFAYPLWFRGIEQFTPSAVTFLALLSPVVASLVGYLVLDQSFTVWQLTGIAMILLAVVGGQRSPAPRSAAVPAPIPAPLAEPARVGSDV
ncbi:EamA family transporter [Kitasatospora sp. MAP5-34]|uniref:EamA family transporter n=1 Tax=Kitasatospora sp. MAP5-34 TaxID=3035102 RepID=UPI002472F241|nr:EamA family transporter [Kitasatospora sp. MAP5-34]MDH6579066.1 putative blue pigment (indigoidine) exporter [Kitasatospora sp. MAP5-34]